MVKIVFNHATVRERADMLEFLDLCADRDVKTVSIWGNEIQKVGQENALRRMRDLGLTASGYNRIGPYDQAGLNAAEAELERAALFGCDHVFLFTGGLPEGMTDLGDARKRAEDITAGLLEKARAIGVSLAIEPLHPMLTGGRTVISTMAQANDICEQLGEGIGVVVDVHHVWWDPQLSAEVRRAGEAGRILGFHVNDWLVPTKDMLRDRGMMGDGVIDLAGIEAMVRRSGFSGPIEVEIFSDHWWARDPAEVLDIAIERCNALFAGGNVAA